MTLFLTLAYLFVIGSMGGWVLELLFRNLVHRSDHWINPGFCTGPYLPIYGFGLCTLFLLASLERYQWIPNPFWNRALLFVVMALCMTLIEYIAGIFCLKYLKVRLWDYSKLWGNIQGIICPIFSLAWAVLGALYYFFIHPHIMQLLHDVAQDLRFSFIIGMFFGIFLIDVIHSANLIVKLKSFAEEQKLVVRYESVKEHIQNHQRAARKRFSFLLPFRSEHPLNDHLYELYCKHETQRSAGKSSRRKRKSAAPHQ